MVANADTVKMHVAPKFHTNTKHRKLICNPPTVQFKGTSFFIGYFTELSVFQIT